MNFGLDHPKRRGRSVRRRVDLRCVAGGGRRAFGLAAPPRPPGRGAGESRVREAKDCARCRLIPLLAYGRHESAAR